MGPLRPIRQKSKRHLTAVALPVGDRLPVSVGASRFPVEEGGPIPLRPSLNYGTFPRQLLKIEEPFLASSLLTEEPFLEKFKKNKEPFLGLGPLTEEPFLKNF